jgi:hypothetical protein
MKKNNSRGGAYRRALDKEVIGGVIPFTPGFLVIFPSNEGKEGGFLHA